MSSNLPDSYNTAGCQSESILFWWGKNKCSINMIHELFIYFFKWNKQHYYDTWFHIFFPGWLQHVCEVTQRKKTTQTLTNSFVCSVTAFSEQNAAEPWPATIKHLDYGRQNKISKLNWQLVICCHLKKKKKHFKPDNYNYRFTLKKNALASIINLIYFVSQRASASPDLAFPP